MKFIWPKFFALGLLCLIFTSISGCTNFLSAVSKGPLEQDPGQRTMGEVLDDSEIETLLKVNLGKLDPAYDDANLHIVSYNAVVLLTGELPSRQLRELAGDTARAINSVRLVHNQINIASKATVYSRSYDSWLGTKLRAKLINSRKIESNRVKVVVENRVVYIMGLLSESEAQHVTDLASTTEGVIKVVRAIELIPEHERAPL